MKKQTVVLIVVVILLGGFIIFDQVSQAMQKQNQLAFQEGQLDGINNTFLTILNKAVQCDPKGVELQYKNQTFRLHLE